MSLRISIYNTKKFFQRTLQSFKTFFSGGAYEKLPKSPLCNPFPCNGENSTNIHNSATIGINTKEFDKFYNDFTDGWDSNISKSKKHKQPKISSSSSSIQEAVIDHLAGNSTTKFSKSSSNCCPPKISINHVHNMEDYAKKPKERLEDAKVREEKAREVAKKLKELEMMDICNMDHVLDIEEVFHYYSRLTCPSYLEIVDKLFKDVYNEFLRPIDSPSSINSKPIRMIHQER